MSSIDYRGCPVSGATPAALEAFERGARGIPELAQRRGDAARARAAKRRPLS